MGKKKVKISWISTGYVGDVKVELIRDEDVDNVDIIEENYIGVSPYIWTAVNVSDAPRSDYKFQITSNSYPNITCTGTLFEIRCEFLPLPHFLGLLA